MTKADLMELVGKKVTVFFKDGDERYGTLGYVDEFSAKHDYRKPDDFYIDNLSFKVSHTRKVIEGIDTITKPRFHNNHKADREI